MSKQTDCGSRACPLRFKLGFEQARESPPSKAAGPMVHLTPLTLYVRLASVSARRGRSPRPWGRSCMSGCDQQQQRKKKASLVDGHPPLLAPTAGIAVAVASPAHHRHRRRMCTAAMPAHAASQCDAQPARACVLVGCPLGRSHTPLIWQPLRIIKSKK